MKEFEFTEVRDQLDGTFVMVGYQLIAEGPDLYSDDTILCCFKQSDNGSWTAHEVYDGLELKIFGQILKALQELNGVSDVQN